MPAALPGPNLVRPATTVPERTLATLELRPRLATEIVDAAFQLYRQYFTALITLTTVIYAPYIVVELLITGGRPIESPTSVLAMSVLTVFGWIIGSLAEAAIVLAVSNSYLRGEPDVQGALSGTRRHFGPVLLVVLLKWLLIMLGAMAGLMVGAVGSGIAMVMTGVVGQAAAGAAAVIVGAALIVIAMLLGGGLGLYMFARYFAVPATVVLEGLGVLAGLRRSRELSAGMKRKVIGALGIPMLLFFMFQFVVIALTSGLPGPAIIGFVLQKAIILVATPILAVIATLLYYDARIQKEGFDIEVMASDLASSSAALP